MNSADEDDAGLIESFGRMVYGISQTPQVWLDNQLMEDREGLVLNWDALEGVFLPQVLQEMFEAYCGLVQALAASDEPWRSAHPLQLPPAQHRRREEANDTAAALPHRLLHQPFIEQALAQPHATALVSEGRGISYGELLARSTGLAQALVSRGVEPGNVVAVCMPRGWQQVAAVLGILIAGGAYLPVDVELPKARQAQLFEQSGARLAVVMPEWPGLALPPGVLAIALSSRTAWVPLNEAPPLRQSLHDLAYVIFTSGSTGVPKGVMIDHRGAANTVEHVNRMFGLQRDDTALMVSALNFDLSVYDIFGLLGAGGCVVIPDHRRSADPEHWLELIDAHGVTVWNSAPPLMSMLASHMQGFGAAPARSVRLALLSGDWIPLSLKTRLETHLPLARMVSLGGATEASIWSIFHPVERIEPQWKSIPYGRPLPNQTMHVLDAHGRECPDHVTGRIHIGGIGLAMGYLHDPEKTAARFIHLADGRRLYDTGDLGRYLPSGEIEFLGREDAQVKLRGHRIELGEIAAALRSHPAVREAIAVVDGDGRTEQQSLWVVLQLDEARRDTLMRPVRPSNALQAAAPRRIAEVLARDPGSPLAPLTPEVRMLWADLDQLYVAALKQVFSNTALARPGEAASVAELMHEMGVVPRYERWMRRGLGVLSALGLITERDERFGATCQWPVEDVAARARAAEAALQKTLQLTEREARWFTLGAEQLAALLRETLHSAELYTADETAAIYQKLFPDSHLQLSGALQALLAQRPSQPLRVMEVGAGLGSATQHLLPLLEGRCERYDFTDISPYFLKRAADRFKACGFLHCSIHDLDRPPELQGCAPHTLDLIVASSVLHDVGDIPGTLKNLHRLLAPGGVLLLLEETRFLASFDLTMGLQQGFDVFRDGREAHPLLSREAWRTRLAAAGFETCEVLNVDGTVADFLGFDVIVAQANAAAHVLDEEALDRHLLERLPAYMKPSGYQVLDEFPTTPNGKIDHRALARPARQRAAASAGQAPGSAVEQRVHDIWREVLGHADFGIHNSFFEIGGDSLLLVEVRNRLKQHLGVHASTTSLFAYPTVATLARHLAAGQPQATDLDEASQRAERQRRALRQRATASHGTSEHA